MAENKVCVVTGASGGIGSRIVKKFYDNGYRVVMLDLNEERLINTLGSMSFSQSRISYYVLDISDEQQVKDTVAQIKQDLGRIDVLINAAGIAGSYCKTAECSFDNFKKIYSVNVFGTFLMMKTTLPLMIEQGSGAIVNFGSVSGMRGYDYEIGYGSSKWAVIGMTKNAANEYGQYNVRINSVSPGWVDTVMMKKTLENYKELGANGGGEDITLGPIHRPAKPDEIADAVYFLSSEQAGYITGENLVVDGGMLLG